jgi:glycosyltransferase involved in cell wall biosynthesis
MVRAAFFMEQHVGHQTFYRNLREHVDADPRIDANWVEITYTNLDSNWNKVPGIPENLVGSLIGRQQVHDGWQQHQVDVAFYSTQVPAVLGGKVINNSPYVLCTDITPIQYDEMSEYYGHQPDKEGFIKSYKHRASTKVFNNASKIVPWTTWVGESLVADYGVSPSNVNVVPVGVNLEIWKANPKQANGLVRFLFVGGDFYRKGGDLLLEAFRQLPVNSSELILVTKESIPEEKNVQVYNGLQPNSPELIALFQESDVFVLPTRAEAYGIVAIEAGASGLPIIMTDIGGTSDIVQDTQNGYLIKVDDVQTLKDRMLTLIENPALRMQMGVYARERVENHFDAKKNATRIVDILLDVVAKKET